ncbi:hypothetical protein ACX8XP_17320 [Calditrichota bacterium LG25]
MSKLVYLRIVAAVAVVMGAMAVVAGGKVLAGISQPDYHVLPWLVKYNVLMGVISLITAGLLWFKNFWGKIGAVVITVGHIIVLLLLLTIFSNEVAQHSVNAMTVRATVWILLLAFVRKNL